MKRTKKKDLILDKKNFIFGKNFIRPKKEVFDNHKTKTIKLGFPLLKKENGYCPGLG